MQRRLLFGATSTRQGVFASGMLVLGVTVCVCMCMFMFMCVCGLQDLQPVRRENKIGNGILMMNTAALEFAFLSWIFLYIIYFQHYMYTLLEAQEAYKVGK